MRRILAALGLLAYLLGLPAALALTITQAQSDYPFGAVPLTSSSGNVANASAAATLAAAANVTTFICGFDITSSGATAAGVVSPTVTGVLGGTLTYTYAAVAGATVSNPSLSVRYFPCLPASAVNTAIVVTVPALGAGNTNATVSAFGYRYVIP